MTALDPLAKRLADRVLAAITDRTIHADADPAAHWPQPHQTCRRCGVAGHWADECMTPEVDR